MRKIKMINILLAIFTALFIHAGIALGDGTNGLSIDSVGRVGIGTSTPECLLQLTSDASTGPAMIASGIKFENTEAVSTASIYMGWYFQDIVQLAINENPVLTISEYGDATLVGTLTEESDASLKKNVEKIDTSLERITKLRGVTYDWKDKEKKSDKRQMGLIAQELEKEFPEAVATDPDGVKSIAYGRLVAPLIEAVKELNAENEKQSREIEDLKKRVVALENK